MTDQISKASLHAISLKRRDAMTSYGQAASASDQTAISYQSGKIAGLDKAMGILGYVWVDGHYKRTAEE